MRVPEIVKTQFGMRLAIDAGPIDAESEAVRRRRSHG
jgi:hypothetical protein